MSETREGYSVTMQPGLELNQLVAKMIGWTGEPLPRFSIDPAPALEAWAWLEENNPWKRPDTIAFALTRDDNGSPSVLHIYGYDEHSTIATGSTYPHAISLAVCEAGRILGVVDSKHKL